MKPRMLLVGLIVVMVAPSLHAQEKAVPARPEELQLAIEKGLFFMEHRSMLWWRNRRCATCHEGQMLVFASNVAKSRGVNIDQQNLDFWTDRWVLTYALARNSDNQQVNGFGLFTGAYVLLHRDPDRDVSKSRTAKWAGVLEGVFSKQSEDGAWSKGASHETPIMALALAELESSKIPFTPELRAEIARRRELTEKWIRDNEPQLPEKTESLCGWAVYEHRRGDVARANRLYEELVSRRREDGGWGITRESPSHLLVTAVALYALKSSGKPDSDSLVAETQRYLLDKQSADGRWRELGRHFHPEAYHSAYDVWTTGFAVTALSLTLPKQPPDAPRRFTPDPELVAVVRELRETAAQEYDGTSNRAPHPTEPEEKLEPKLTESSP